MGAPNDTTNLAFEHGPAWRWHVAKFEATQRMPRRAHSVDPDVRKARAFLRHCGPNSENKTNAAQQFPAIAAAQAMAEDKSVADQLRILILGNCSTEQIVARLQVEAEVIDIWESLFFDVRKRRAAVIWINAHVIQPVRNDDVYLAAQMKYAWAGGPLAAQSVLDLEAGEMLKSGERLFDWRLKLELKAMAALDAPMRTPEQDIRYLQLYYELRAREQRLELESRRLQFRIEDSIRRKQVVEGFQQFREKKMQQETDRTVARANERTAIRDAKVWMKNYIDTMEMRQREQERIAAKQRAALSPLAELRWEFSDTTDQEMLQPAISDRRLRTESERPGQEQVPASICA